MDKLAFFEEREKGRGPELSSELVVGAETALAVRLPQAYLELLRERNGGTPRKRCFRTRQATSWGPEHVRVQTLLGVGYDDGLDGEYGSQYMIDEWGYPMIGVVICDTPSAGHDAIMLDYTKCGPQGEPEVVYIDEKRRVLPLADCFAEFVAGLVDCSTFDTGES